MTDPIADMLTRIRNGLAVKKQEITIPYSKVKFKLAKILAKDQWVGEIKEDKEKKVIKIMLQYDAKRPPTINNLRRISKPGCRIYANHEHLPIVKGGLGIAILSTSSGIMTNNQARKRKIGGEVLCEIY